ncbi:catalase-domain-containing protein [Athelia psychrophila]|uniref:Catalase n=1 Tax=Athelia psychrophila TaxID=1759441 RepID=A0A166WR97_9AGAM|nr:catalase-domain-containing protein [Fibularhizoctonia sp. CBS 109695]
MLSSSFAIFVLTAHAVAANYTFDLFQGVNLQDDTASKAPSDLYYTTGGGVEYAQPYEAQRVSETGPLLTQDFHLTESLAHFHRERIPERVVHAKGAGAHGYFETTTDVGKKYSMADVFQRVGEKTPLSMRFSAVGGEEGSADVVRDPRGFAIKLRTKKGIWDWVWNNTPVFFIRDPAKFPNFIHTQKRNPQTHLKDKDMYWDYLSSNPESLYQVMRLFSDLGTPYGFRHMNGWSGHTYRLVQDDDSWHYVKFSAYTNQGVKNHTNAEANFLAGTNPDFGTQDLFEAIEAKNYPSWTVYVQAITPEAAKTFKWNVLDLTKDWSDEDVPREEVGKIVLTQNPNNYFAEIEQLAFAPGHMVAGCEPSEDPVLQARLFAYPDAQRYRLGVNYQTIPVNCPFAPVANFQRDGAGVHDDNQGSRPNYPSTQAKLNLPKRPYQDANHTIWTGGAVRYLSEVSEIDFAWPKIFWGNLTTHDQENFIGNVVGHLGLVTSDEIKKRQLALFSKVDKTLGQRLAQGMNITL